VLKTRFERFPASLKGAFVFQGADGDPHSIRFEWARITRVPSGPTQPMPVEDRILDVAPARDLFVPFEVGLSELGPGWYEIRSSIMVDAGGHQEFSSRPFSIAWPRGEIRRGNFRIGRTVRAGGRSFVVERLELEADVAIVTWRPQAARGLESRRTDEESQGHAIVLADGAPLELLPDEAAGLRSRLGPGERRTVSYPLPRSAANVTVVVRMASGEESGRVPIPLL